MKRLPYYCDRNMKTVQCEKTTSSSSSSQSIIACEKYYTRRCKKYIADGDDLNPRVKVD